MDLLWEVLEEVSRTWPVLGQQGRVLQSGTAAGEDWDSMAERGGVALENKGAPGCMQCATESPSSPPGTALWEGMAGTDRN